MKIAKNAVLYVLLFLASLLVMFPFLWMIVTAFKVPGTGNKMQFIPADTRSFYYSTPAELTKLNIRIPDEMKSLFELKKMELYDGFQTPSINSVIEMLEALCHTKFSDSIQQSFREHYSGKFNINKLDVEQFTKLLPMSNLSADAIVNFRTEEGDFDSPEGLYKIPLFSSKRMKDLNLLFKSRPDAINHLDEGHYAEDLALNEEEIQAYRSYKQNSERTFKKAQDLADIPRFTPAQVDQWKSAFFSNKLYTTKNFRKVLFEFEPRKGFTLGRAFFNSLIVAIGCALLTVLVCTLAAYALAKKAFSGKKYLNLAFYMIWLIPGMMFVVPQYAIVTQLGGMNTFWAMIVPHAANIFGLFLMKQYIEAIPNSLFEAAKMDGASELDLFSIIIIPLTKPIIATLFLMTFLGQWSNFLWQLIVNTPESMNSTLPVTLALFKGQYTTDWTLLMAGSCVMLVPIVILFLFSQKYFIAGITSGAVKE
jgi:multiple sugar transport system permease protein